jgi:hypothetical protein
LNEHGVKLTLSSTSQNLSGLGGIGALSRGVGHRGGFDSGGHYCLKFVSVDDTSGEFTETKRSSFKERRSCMGDRVKVVEETVVVLMKPGVVFW